MNSISLIIPLAVLSSIILLPNFTGKKSARTEADTFDELYSQPYSFCFAPGTPPEIIAKHSSAQTFKSTAFSLASTDPQKAFQINNRWTTTATNGSSQATQGDPVTLTWSIPNEDEAFIDAFGDGAPANSDLRSRLTEIYGGSTDGPAADQPWFPLFVSVFDDISANTGITFIYEPNDDGADLANINPGILGVRGDIRITGRTIDGNSQVLAFNFFPNFGDMVIDTGDNFYDDISSNSLGLRNVLAHEIGHGLGLNHVCPIDETKLMEPFISDDFDGLQFDEMFSLQRNYGDPLERHNANLTNDDIDNAAPLNVQFNVPFESQQMLSIDDNSDVDFYSFQAEAGNTLTAFVTPSPDSYLEGPQNADGSCTAGTLFDSSTRHNLSLELFGPDQSLIASAAASPIGSPESINPTTAETSGTYYLKVAGNNADTNQLYSLAIGVEGPSATFSLITNSLNAELFSTQNGAADPMEPVEFNFTLSNIGVLAAENTMVTLSGPDGFIPIDVTTEIGELAIDESITFPLTFALDAECNDDILLTLQVAEENLAMASFPISINLGSGNILLFEDFDNSPALPSGWIAFSIREGTSWSIDSNADTLPNSIFTGNSETAGESTIFTPQFGPIPEETILSFRHSFDTEFGFDGGVLEILIDNGVWRDFVEMGGEFLTGEYTGFLDNFQNSNSLRGRNSWNGDSGGFITTTALFPPEAINRSARLRWRFGHDSFSGGIGWNIDTVSVELPVCDETGPLVSMSSDDLVTSEFFLNDQAEVTFQTPVPVLNAVPLTVTTSGSADMLTDFADPDILTAMTLPANSSSLSITLDAIEDSLVEGPENLTIALPDTGDSVTLTINDSPYQNWAFDNLSTSSSQLPEDDPDNDSLTNLEEYIFATNPLSTSPSIRPELESNFVDSALRVINPISPVPADLSISPFSSPNLIDWDSDLFISIQGNEFVLEAPTSPYFMRLEYSLLENDAPLTPSDN